MRTVVKCIVRWERWIVTLSCGHDINADRSHLLGSKMLCPYCAIKEADDAKG